MLKTEEIIEIENRWKKHKTNHLLKIIIAFLSVLCLVAILLFAFLYIKKSKSNVAVDNTPSVATNVTENIVSTPIATTQNSSIPTQIIEEPKVVAIEDKPPVVKKVTTTKKPKPIVTKPKPANKPDLIQNNAQNNIIIETQNVNNIQTLIERFNSTRNIVFANMISEEYYEKKDYSNSLKWALTANELDSKNEKSWIMFAKSKAKLGFQDEAIHALEIFTKHSPNSNGAINLLKNLKNGNFK